MPARALVTGVTGQDGAYLSRLLLDKGYEVHGIRRRASSANTERIDGLSITLHEGDLTDGSGLARIVREVQPDEVYNLAAQSHVGTSFEQPEYTANVDGLGVLRLLDALRGTKARFYQASTSELFGKVAESPQNEQTPFYPRSPYGVAKLYAYWLTVNYREAYGMYACNGILFNHESPLRGAEFVTRKITQGLARIKAGKQSLLRLGNLGAKRDWGHARDYVEAMWLMLQQDAPEDFVIASGEQHSVREFVTLAGREIGMDIKWRGNGPGEVGCDGDRMVVAVDPKFYRPSEVETLLGDASKARQKLGWIPKTSFGELVAEMMREDMRCQLARIQNS